MNATPSNMQIIPARDPKQYGVCIIRTFEEEVVAGGAEALANTKEEKVKWMEVGKVAPASTN